MATLVNVIEDHGYDCYVNEVKNLEDIQHEELGRHLDKGPKAVKHEVHLDSCNDDILVQPRAQKWSHLNEKPDVVNALITGIDCPSFVDTTHTVHAANTLNVTFMDDALIDEAWQRRARDLMHQGELPVEPKWMTDFHRESLLNEALSNSFPTRMIVLYDLVLDGIVTPEQYENALPNMAEVATVCMRSGVRRDRGESRFRSWDLELRDWAPKQVAHVYELITGDAVAINQHTVKHVAAKLSMPQLTSAVALAHFMRVRTLLDYKYFEHTSEFDDILTDAQVIVESLDYGDDSAWLELEDQFGDWEHKS